MPEPLKIKRKRLDELLERRTTESSRQRLKARYRAGRQIGTVTPAEKGLGTPGTKPAAEPAEKPTVKPTVKPTTTARKPTLSELVTSRTTEASKQRALTAAPFAQRLRLESRQARAGELGYTPRYGRRTTAASEQRLAARPEFAEQEKTRAAAPVPTGREARYGAFRESAMKRKRRQYLKKQAAS